jgi:phage repressor protein C with HTH and peptisase S24 domain
VGINRPAIGSYEEGRAEPKITALQLIADFFNITIDQLVKADLSITAIKNNTADLNGSSLRILTTVVNQNDNELITLVPAKASAGYLNGYGDVEYIESLPRFTLPLPDFSTDRTYRTFQINGDSMEPIPSGSYIIGEFLTDWHQIKDGKTYVVVTRDEGVVYKRVYPHSSGELILKSDNPIYSPYSVHFSRVLEVWKAIGYISTSLPQPNTMNIHKLSEMIVEMRKEIEELKRR